MALATGRFEYSHGAAPVSALAISWSEDELREGLDGPIRAIVFDSEGQAQITDMLSGLSGTGFDATALTEELAAPREPESWRVGEAIAEGYLKDHRNCLFPWPNGRDNRRASASLPGADLVGLRKQNSEHIFAFGEVKTSYQKAYPPSVMDGRHGLKKQIEELRDDDNVRQTLILYLGHRARGRDWEDAFKQAFIRYGKNRTDVAVYGVLIRDVTPNSEDLRARTNALSGTTPKHMTIELLAIYLPSPSIVGLGKRAHAIHARGAK